MAYTKTFLKALMVVVVFQILFMLFAKPAHAGDYVTKVLESGDRVVLTSEQCPFNRGNNNLQSMYVEYKKGSRKTDMHTGCYYMMGNKAIITGAVVGQGRRWLLDIDNTFTYGRTNSGGNGIF